MPDGGRIDAIAGKLAHELGLDGRDLISRDTDSVTLLWWVWSQPFYVNVSQVDATVVVRAGGTSLAFKRFATARWWAHLHNETTTLWHWYADPHPTLSGAGVWRCFAKLCVGVDTEERDLAFAVSLLTDMAADHALKHFNNAVNLAGVPGPEELVPLPEMRNGLAKFSAETMTLLPGYALVGGAYDERLQAVSKHRIEIHENPGLQPPAFLLPTDLQDPFDLQAALPGFETAQTHGESTSIVSFDNFYRVREPGVIVLLRTDIANPAMGDGLLVHLPIPVETTYDGLEQLNRAERAANDSVPFLGAWAPDPLNMWAAGLGLPSDGETAANVPLAHTAFYPNRYRTWVSQPEIVAGIYSRTLHA